MHTFCFCHCDWNKISMPAQREVYIMDYYDIKYVGSYAGHTVSTQGICKGD